jgi:hypothetical protein
MLAHLHMKILTNSKDSNSLLIMHDGYLVAILVRLEDEVHGDNRAMWHFEAHFDHVPATGQLFRGISEAKAWIASEVDADGVGLHPIREPLQQPRRSSFLWMNAPEKATSTSMLNVKNVQF